MGVKWWTGRATSRYRRWTSRGSHEPDEILPNDSCCMNIPEPFWIWPAPWKGSDRTPRVAMGSVDVPGTPCMVRSASIGREAGP